MFRKKWVIITLAVIVLLGSGGAYLAWKEKYGGGLNNKTAAAQKLEPVQTIEEPKDTYDVIVVGTDPEGVAAAVSAARNGLKTLLVDGRNREILGGLMTVGWLNSLDNNYKKPIDWLKAKPEILNKGIFQQFYEEIEGTSFDVVTAANVFNKLVQAQPNIEVLLKTQSIEPILADGSEGIRKVTGAAIKLANGTQRQVSAPTVIDATQDGDFFAAAGVPYTFGKEDLGDPNVRMAVTVVFRLKGADEDFWSEVRKKLENDGDPNTSADLYSAYGYGDIKEYKAQNPTKARMRGLNIGRQNDETILINALQLFGIDGSDPASVQEAYDIAKQEIPHVLAFMQEKHEEFKRLELADDYMAPELYVRETRHMEGLYRLTIIDILENRDQWDRVGFGSYAVDIQSVAPTDPGAEMLYPSDKYAVPFRSLVPVNVDGLLVVGRSASYDTLPHGSARVIPVGMAAAESAGIAAKVAADAGVSFRKMAESKPLIEQMQAMANEQGMELKPYTAKKQEYQEHRYYEGLKAALYHGLVVGGHQNDFKYEEPSNPQRLVNNFIRLKKMYPDSFPGEPSNAVAHYKLEAAQVAKLPLSLQQAAYTIARTVGLKPEPQQAEQVLVDKGLLKQELVNEIKDKENLNNGEVYMMVKDLLEALLKLRF